VSGDPATIFKWDLEWRRQTIVGGSHGLFSPRLSPDGRWLAAIRKDSSELVVQDAATGQWSSLTDDAVTYPAWTRDSAWLHFRRAHGKGGFFRVDPLHRQEEVVATAVPEDALAGGEWGAWSGLTPGGAPLLLLDLRHASPAQRGVAVLVEPSSPEERKTTR
jgi:hypothetical protein